MNPITTTGHTVSPVSLFNILQPVEEAVCTEFNYCDLVQQMVHEKSMRTAFRPEFAQVPDLYEKIKEQVYNHFPAEKDLLKRIREAIGDIMNLEDAEYFLNKFPEKKHLRRIREADRIRALSYTFNTIDEARNVFAIKKEGCLKLLELEYFMAAREALHVKKGISDPRLTDEEFETLRDNYATAVDNAFMSETIPFDKMPLIRHFNLIKNAHKHPLLKAHVEKSQKKIDEYASGLCQVVEMSNDKPMPPGFKEFLCGPKAMLLEYYGFGFTNISDTFSRSFGRLRGYDFLFPFYNTASRTMSFRYSLENDTIADLEKEMRTDLISCGIEELPDPICASETTIIPPSLTEIELSIQKQFNQKADDWPTMTDSNKQYWLEEFLVCTHLESLGIRFDQVIITSFVKELALKGILLLRECEVPFTYDIKRISFNLDGLPRDSIASFYETRRILEAGKSYFEELKTRYKPKP